MPLEPALSAPAGSRGRHPLPEKERFAETLGEYAIDGDSLVIAYDDGTCTYACRLWWMLRWVGHDRVRVLDGGMHLWEQNGLSTTQEQTKLQPTQFEIRPSLTRVCGAADVLEGDHLLVDARTLDRFQGFNETLDHTSGHIPGAVCMPFGDNQDESKQFIRDSDRFDELDKNQPIVCYCGSGVSATNNIMALMLAGFPEPALYPGSWSEWIEDPSRPIAREQESTA